MVLSGGTHQLTALGGLPKLQQAVFPFALPAQSAAAVHSRIAKRPKHAPAEPGTLLSSLHESTHAEVSIEAVQLGTVPPLSTMLPQQVCAPHPASPDAPTQSTAYCPLSASQDLAQLAARAAAFTQQCSSALQ